MRSIDMIRFVHLFATIGLLGGPAVSAPLGATQVIELRSGWNLISLQVGTGITPAQFQAALGPADASKLRSIWGFGDASVPGSAPWQWKFHRTDPGQPNDLTLLQPGKGYWVEVAGFCQATLGGVPWDGALAVRQGWNLVGFPGLKQESAEVLDLASVFGSHFERVSQVWEWDASSAQRFTGYDITSIPQTRELAGVQPGRAYWVYALSDFVLTPLPSLALPGDADASPLEEEVPFAAPDFPDLADPAAYVGTNIRKVRAGGEDVPFDLNQNHIIDSPFTQDTLLFDVGVDRKVISITNRGTGSFNWSIENTVPWLFTEAVDEKEHPGNSGREKNASGTISSETDAVTLFVDTRGMLPGRHAGQLLVHLGGLTRIISILLDVPVASGDWKGYATTQSVNGRNVGIGAVDMGINLFMEEGSSANFRAVLNRDTSLLFPRDVFMNGVFYSGNSFSLTTNFEMPTGDRNAPPFDTFQQPANYNSLPGVAKAQADFDYNGDRKLDVANPFPFPIRRQITLLGERKTPNRMEGSYIESITGMLPSGQPVFIQGTFYLDRQNFEPTKRSIFNQSTTNSPILIGSTSGVLYRETTINVASAVSIQGVTLTLNLSFPDPTRLTITLYGPNGQSVVIHSGGAALPTSLDLSQFNGLLGNGAWKLRVAWTPTAERGYFNGWGLNIQGLATYTVAGKVVGELDAAPGLDPLANVHLVLSGSNIIKQADTAPFVLTVGTTATSTTATLASTAALYAGMPTSGNPGIPTNATVANIVSGTAITLSAPATATTSAPTTFGAPGEFKFTGLTENNYTLALSRPGFETRLIPFFLNNANLYIGHGAGQGVASTNPSTLSSDPIQLAPLNVTTPELRVGPFIGQEPLFTSFTALIPLAQLNALGTIQSATWTFGDGTVVVDTASSTDDVAQTTARHLYESAGIYAATLVLDGTLDDLSITSAPIHVQRIIPDAAMPLTGNGQPAAQCIVAGFVGSFAAPVLEGGDIVEQAEQGVVTQVIKVRQTNGSYADVAIPDLSKAVVYQETKRDSGSFDIDRPPLMSVPRPFHPTAEDSDFTGQLYHSGDGSVGLPFLSREYADLEQWEKQSFAGDISAGFSIYTPPQIAGVITPDRFRVFSTIGGPTFGIEPLRVGAISLQVGRVEP